MLHMESCHALMMPSVACERSAAQLESVSQHCFSFVAQRIVT